MLARVRFFRCRGAARTCVGVEQDGFVQQQPVCAAIHRGAADGVAKVSAPRFVKVLLTFLLRFGFGRQYVTTKGIASNHA